MIKLIPVIEITCYGSATTDDIPSNRDDNDWESYIQLCQAKAGFEDKMQAYKIGSGFYSLPEITECNLTKLMQDEVTELQEDEDWEWDNLCAFTGGYVLTIDGEDILFPQCCCDLRDIRSWGSILKDSDPDFWIGHPSPSIVVDGDSITFDLEHPNVPESFSHSPSQLVYKVDKQAFAEALANTEKELKAFVSRIESINKKEKLNIPDVAVRMVYGE